ncbi:DNA-binding protein, partial [Photobacterium piscicola]|uniref:DNA-binding protein n=1 Tax=Photobacterium piscicola TaxID=1378299 RepID=UPI002E173407|nr:DNA-binding protein [Photobacterium piscicola]
AVRERLGSGSNSTINTVLQMWRERNTSKEVVTVEVPEVVATAHAAALAAVWGAAKDQADRDLADKRAMVDREKTELQADLDGLAADLDDANAELAESDTVITNLNKVVADKDSEIARLEKLVAKLNKEKEAGIKLQGKYEQLDADHAALLATTKPIEATTKTKDTKTQK